MNYRVQLANFEGPLDLLLFFIQRDKLNIYDIPIAIIIKEYSEYLDLMKLLNIRIAGEFIVMAAMLMQIKAKMLLPRETSSEDQLEDPRTDLVNRLLEYKQFKDSARAIWSCHEAHSQTWPRGMEISYSEQKENPSAYLKNVSLFDLLSVFKQVMDKLPKSTGLEIRHEPVNVEQQIGFIREKLRQVRRLTFRELVTAVRSRLKIIATFLAVLELLRSRELKLQQDTPFGEIILTGME
ncbi:MAG: segregation/condensation protein A [FCB group bacterium]|nr:segregation/condensation protein A [FCB group bacterium]